jgi:hypothetical protein
MILPQIPNLLSEEVNEEVNVGCALLYPCDRLFFGRVISVCTQPQAALTRGPLEAHYAVSKSNFLLMTDPLCVLLLSRLLSKFVHTTDWVDAVHSIRTPGSGSRGRNVSLTVQKKNNRPAMKISFNVIYLRLGNMEIMRGTTDQGDGHRCLIRDNDITFMMVSVHIQTQISLKITFLVFAKDDS